MANCSNCGGPLPEKSMICTYCGTRNEIDLKGVHKYTIHTPETDRICPRCDTPMATIDLKIEGTFLIERCHHCFGLFFDPGELEKLLQATVDNVFVIDHKRIHDLNQEKRHEEYAAGYIKCPVCRNLMNRVNFGARSGVIVDRCKEHGIWVDGGELRHLMEWVKAGGKLLHQQQGGCSLETKHKTTDYGRDNKINITKYPAGSYQKGHSDFDSFAEVLLANDSEMFRIVKKVAWNLFR